MYVSASFHKFYSGGEEVFDFIITLAFCIVSEKRFSLGTPD
jgi:hypothetical protein